MTADLPVTGASIYDWAWFIATIIGILVIALPLMLAVAMIIYAERKIWAAIALRRGPERGRPMGPAAKLRRRPEGVPQRNDHPDAAPTRACS